MRPKQRPDRARRLRSLQTDVERRLRLELRDRRPFGHKFRRQVPVGPFIVDVACVDQHLAIELDGSQHALSQPYDERRTAVLEEHGWRVLRFWNGDLIENIDGVLERIAAALPAPPSPHPGPLPQAGEGVGS